MVVIHTVTWALYLVSVIIYNVIYYKTQHIGRLTDKDITKVVNLDYMIWCLSSILLFCVQIVMIYIFWGLSHDEWIEFDPKETMETVDD